MTDKEQYLIDKLSSPYTGDDAAVVGDWIYSADAFCEDVHFRRRWMEPYRIGRKAMLVNISDAVAMNASPKYALCTISMPYDIEKKDIDMLIEGLTSAADEWGCEIIGGDTVGGEKLNISITIISQSSDPLFRTGINDGDLLAYTGTLGKSLDGLRRLESGEKISEDSRFYEPSLRADFVKQARPYLRAGMDISDGLFCDTNKLLDLNKYGIDILENIDYDTGMSGEEYEMLVAIDPIFKNMIEKIASDLDLEITFFAKISQNTERLPCKSHHFG